MVTNLKEMFVAVKSQRKDDIKWLTSQIKYLGEVQKSLKKEGRRSHVIALKIGYALALREFLKTGCNEVHKGRGTNPNYVFYYKGSNCACGYPYVLIEDMVNADVRQFVNKVNRRVLTLDLFEMFTNSAERRCNS